MTIIGSWLLILSYGLFAKGLYEMETETEGRWNWLAMVLAVPLTVIGFGLVVDKPWKWADYALAFGAVSMFYGAHFLGAAFANFFTNEKVKATVFVAPIIAFLIAVPMLRDDDVVRDDGGIDWSQMEPDDCTQAKDKLECEAMNEMLAELVAEQAKKKAK